MHLTFLPAAPLLVLRLLRLQLAGLIMFSTVQKSSVASPQVIGAGFHRLACQAIYMTMD